MKLSKKNCDQLGTTVSSTDTNRFVLTAKYGTDKSDLEKKIIDGDKTIPDTSWLQITKKSRSQFQDYWNRKVL